MRQKTIELIDKRHPSLIMQLFLEAHLELFSVSWFLTSPWWRPEIFDLTDIGLSVRFTSRTLRLQCCTILKKVWKPNKEQPSVCLIAQLFSTKRLEQVLCDSQRPFSNMCEPLHLCPPLKCEHVVESLRFTNAHSVFHFCTSTWTRCRSASFRCEHTRFKISTNNHKTSHTSHFALLTWKLWQQKLEWFTSTYVCP